MNSRRLHARASELFVELRSLSAAACEAALAGLEDEGPDGPALACEVRSLLAHDVADVPEAASHSPLEIGARLGPYRVVECIGRGGSGHVFLAEQTEPVRRSVAIKVVPAAAVDPELGARFEVERRALERAAHPNVARLLDAGRTPAGLPYLVMDYVDGAPITEHCRRLGLALEDRVRLLIAAGAGVQHAHQRGVIHRDLKPANVVVAEIGGRPTPVVLDFGIAKPVVGAFAGDLPVTGGWPVGTPAYMAPEQAGFGPVDTRADVYALGAMLYELVAGRPPIPPADDLATTFARLRDFVPPPPSRVRAEAPDRAPRALLTDLDAIALRALEKSPDRRYPTVAAWCADLERALAAEPIEARPPTWHYRARCFARRRRGLVASAVLVVAAVVAGVAGLTWGLIEAGRQRREAVAQREVVERVNTFFTDDVLGAAAPDRLGPDAKPLALLRHAGGLVDQRLADRPLIGAAIHHALGELFAELGELDRADSHLARALERRRAGLGSESPLTVCSEIATASLLTRRERYAEALPVLEAAIPRARRLLPPDHPAIWGALNDLGVVLDALGRDAEAVPILEEALAGRRRVLGASSYATVASLSNLALVYDQLGQTERSLGMLERAIEAARELPDQPRATLLGLENNAGTMLRELGRDAEARPHLAAAVELAQALFDEDHPAVLQTRANLAGLDAVLDPERAFRDYADIAERWGRTLGPDAESALTARHGQWTSARKGKRHAEAVVGFEALLADVIRALPANHLLVPQTRHSLAYALRDAGRSADAAAQARLAAVGFGASSGAESPRAKAALAFAEELEQELARERVGR